MSKRVTTMIVIGLLGAALAGALLEPGRGDQKPGADADPVFEMPQFSAARPDPSRWIAATRSRWAQGGTANAPTRQEGADGPIAPRWRLAGIESRKAQAIFIDETSGRMAQVGIGAPLPFGQGRLEAIDGDTIIVALPGCSLRTGVFRSRTPSPSLDACPDREPSKGAEPDA